MTRPNRRAILKSAAALAGANLAAALLPDSPARAQLPPPSTDPPGVTVLASGTGSIAPTASGPVRGYIRNDIRTFKGIPYGSIPARFLPAVKPVSWTAPRSSMQYGYVCPQIPRDAWADDEVAFMFDWDDGRPGEDCLLLNIWTPALSDNKNRPVMLWLHGGGYTAGSGQELKSYDGENLSRRGDSVVVSLNHRLGILGFLDLAPIGDHRFAQSGNVGMTDIVLALQWIKDNISSFGGDPNNVTIFGQSGGGGKVTTLMAMPAAHGLFHKAIVESGTTRRPNTPAEAARLTAAVLDELGLKPLDIDQLQSLPVHRVVAAGVAAAKRFALPPNTTLVPGDSPRLEWQPLLDGTILPHDPLDPQSIALSADIPLLIGTVANEVSPSLYAAALESMTEDDLKSQATRIYGARASLILDTARRAYPNVKPVEIFSLISPNGFNVVKQATCKAALNAAPVYRYLFRWQTPILDSRPRAHHCAEIAFAFDNTDRCATMTGGGPAPRALAAKISPAWIHFARHGNPNHDALPTWPPFTIATGPTMIFDTQCEIQNHPDRELRDLMQG